MPFKLPRLLRIALVAGMVLIAAGVGLFIYRYVTEPVTLKVAAGSIDGEAVALMSVIASRLASTDSHIRLKVVDTETALGASKAQVDLAIVRADLGDLSATRTVVLVTYGVLMIVVPSGSTIEGIDDLKGKTVGVLGGEANRRVVEVLTQEYDLARMKVQFKDVALTEAQKELQSKKVHALLVMMPGRGLGRHRCSTSKAALLGAIQMCNSLIPPELKSERPARLVLAGRSVV